MSHIVGMGRLSINTPEKAVSEYTADFLNRTRLARVGANLSQQDIATILGITQGLYKTYEIRTPLPHRFVAAFCRATRVSERWLFGGQGNRRAD